MVTLNKDNSADEKALQDAVLARHLEGKAYVAKIHGILPAESDEEMKEIIRLEVEIFLKEHEEVLCGTCTRIEFCARIIMMQVAEKRIIFHRMKKELPELTYEDFLEIDLFVEEEKEYFDRYSDEEADRFLEEDDYETYE
ncbi:MAG: hypothetical protein FVQ80_11630 [Planctomycetes bacterium]|nr:hypothetical protein [Planctomycetota bacterium]